MVKVGGSQSQNHMPIFPTIMNHMYILWHSTNFHRLSIHGSQLDLSSFHVMNVFLLKSRIIF